MWSCVEQLMEFNVHVYIGVIDNIFIVLDVHVCVCLVVFPFHCRR